MLAGYSDYRENNNNLIGSSSRTIWFLTRNRENSKRKIDEGQRFIRNQRKREYRSGENTTRLKSLSI